MMDKAEEFEVTICDFKLVFAGQKLNLRSQNVMSRSSDDYRSESSLESPHDADL